MKLNDMVFSGNNGEIYYEKANGKTIKLGTFEFDYKYNHATIDLGVCKFEYEYRTDEMRKSCVGLTTHMYWFKSNTDCDRYHGTYTHDYKWANDLFDEVTPFTEEINELIHTMITVVINRIWRTAIGMYNEGEAQ